MPRAPWRAAVLSLVSTTLIACGLHAPAANAATVRPADAVAYDSAVLADQPLFYWPLNETVGPVHDVTGHAAASTVSSATFGVPGAMGTALSFDGISNWLKVPYTATMRLPASFSAEVWAKLPATPQSTGWPTLFSAGSVLAGHFGAAVWVSSDSSHTVHFKRNGIDVGTVRGLTTTGYRQLAFTWDNNAKRWTWYVDGTADSTGVLTGLSGTDVESVPLAVGAMLSSATGTPTNLGKLLLDNLSLYGTVLSPTRVAAHYAAATSTTTVQTATGYVGGIAVGGLQPWDPNRAANYQKLGATHATWIRSDLGWEYLEPSNGVWRFDEYDPVVADAKAAGMRYLGILHTVPGWANNNAGDYGMPADPSLMVNYCYQTAHHYIPLGVTDYEIGNEVNLPHPGWAASGAVYATQYLAPCVSGVRRAASELSSTVNILFGSLAPTDWTGGTDPATFLGDAYANGAGGLFNAVGWHPYTGSDMPAASPHMTTDPTTLNDIMAAHGDAAKKIWATEYGAPTGGTYSVTEQQQSTMVSQALPTWYGHSFAGPLFWYSGRDTGTSTTDREQHFGLLRYDGTAKPAYATLAGMLSR